MQRGSEEITREEEEQEQERARNEWKQREDLAGIQNGVVNLGIRAENWNEDEEVAQACTALHRI